jgi:hypothetical protein
MPIRSSLSIAFPSFVLGALSAGVVTGWIVAAGCHLREAGLRSKSVFPTRAVIEDLDATLERGDCKLASKKVTLFRTRWQEWIDQDSSPSEWFNEIVNLH